MLLGLDAGALYHHRYDVFPQQGKVSRSDWINHLQPQEWQCELPAHQCQSALTHDSRCRDNDTFLLKAQILSHSMVTTDREPPCAMMNCLSPSTVIPRRSTPRTVGKRGSSLQRQAAKSSTTIGLECDTVVRLSATVYFPTLKCLQELLKNYRRTIEELLKNY